MVLTNQNIALLRRSFRDAMRNHPFTIDAIVILPEHIHCIWTLPVGDADFSTRWRLIKSHFSRHCARTDQGQVSASRQRKQEKAVWQRRFWEHQIRNEQDFVQHVEYIHYNPVKHKLVTAPSEWAYSSFGRYVQAGVYLVDWGAAGSVAFPSDVGHE